MAHPYHHAQSSARRFGGVSADYEAIHNWFDATKELVPNFRHRALRHHTHGIFEAERVFGTTITNSDGRQIPVRFIGEQHVREDCAGLIPTPADWLKTLSHEPWMTKPGKMPVLPSLNGDAQEEALPKSVDLEV